MVEPRERIFRVNIAVEQELAGSYQIQGTQNMLVMFLNQKTKLDESKVHPRRYRAS